MTLVVDVPLNTMLADLDETLRALLRARARAPRLRRRGGRVRRARARLVEPALRADREPLPLRPAGVEGQPPRGVALAARGERPGARGPPADDHGVLLRRHGVDAGGRRRAPPALPGARRAVRVPRAAPRPCWSARLAQAAERFGLEGRIGQPKSDGKADFWTAVGGQYKASLDYVVTLACESGVAYERGPEVRSQTMLMGAGGRARDGARDAPLRRHGAGQGRRSGRGRVGPLPAHGLWAATDARGRFILSASRRAPRDRRPRDRRHRGDGPGRRARERPGPHPRRASRPARRRRADRMGIVPAPRTALPTMAPRTRDPEKLGGCCHPTISRAESCWGRSSRSCGSG